MDIKLSEKVELVKEINQILKRNMAEEPPLTKMVIAMELNGKLYRKIFTLEEEDVMYLYKRYKPDAEATLEALKNHADEIKKEL